VYDLQRVRHLDKGGISERVQQLWVGEQQRLSWPQHKILGRAVDAGQLQPRRSVIGVEERDRRQLRSLVWPPPGRLSQRVVIHHLAVQAVHRLRPQHRQLAVTASVILGKHSGSRKPNLSSHTLHTPHMHFMAQGCMMNH
jgi:hypothetical protein